MSTEGVANSFKEALERMDYAGAFGMLAEDGRYIVIGTTDASRTYSGRKDLLENLVPLLSTFREPPVLKFEKPIVSGDRAVLLGSGRGVGPYGPYDQPYYAFVTRVRESEFMEIIEFMDTSMLDKALFGK